MPRAVPDESLALVVVITGVLILSGSAALQVVWLIVIAFVGGAGMMRRSAARKPDGEEPTP